MRFSVGRERRIGGAEGRRTGGSSEARSSQRGVHRATVGSGGDGGGGAYGPTARQVAPAERSAAESPVSPACSGGWNGDGWLVVDVGRLATAGDRPAVCRPPFAPRLPSNSALGHHPRSRAFPTDRENRGTKPPPPHTFIDALILSLLLLLLRLFSG